MALLGSILRIRLRISVRVSLSEILFIDIAGLQASIRGGWGTVGSEDGGVMGYLRMEYRVGRLANGLLADDQAYLAPTGYSLATHCKQPRHEKGPFGPNSFI